MKFEDLGLCDVSLEALKAKGFEEPTEIQEKIIPRILEGDADIIGQAQTGTGKTAAFGLPILDILTSAVLDAQASVRPARFKTKPVRALILTPTRELAIQVAKEIDSLRGGRDISLLPVYGGQYIGRQLEGLKKGVDIVVGTPGRVIDHLERGTLDLSEVSYFVLDEADEMLAMGFIEDVTRILENAPAQRRILLFSATMPEPIRRVAETYMSEYELVRVEKPTQTVELTEQIYFEVREEDKFEALCRLIDREEVFYGLVFCRTRIGVDALVRRLQERGYSAEGLHGDISQAQRELILGRFRGRRVTVLAATDVAARGIDIVDLRHVVNYSLPQDVESYIHRIGRTGRAGSAGKALSFVTPSERRMITGIKNSTRAEIRRQELPSVEEVLTAKKERLLKALGESREPGREFRDMAHMLLAGAEKTAADVLAAVLAHAFGDVLDARRYGVIREIKKRDSGEKAEKKKRTKAEKEKPVKAKKGRGKPERAGPGKEKAAKGKFAWNKGKKNAAGGGRRSQGKKRKRRGDF
jgi:ATP-dependent RNA helicase DeaD